MADDVNKLAVLIEANTRSYENAMKKIVAQTNAAMGKAAASTRKMDTALSRLRNTAGAAGPAFGRLAAVMAAGFSAGAAIKLADAFTRVENSLKVAGLAGTELARVQDRLFETAQRNMAPLEDLAGLFGKVAQVQGELGVTTDELLGFTENIAVALRVSGKSASEAKGALMQLSQALASGTVRAEEYNSVNEGAPAILRAVALGLKEAEGSLGKLRALVIDGKVSSEAFFRAFEAGAYVLKDQVAGSTATVEQQMTRLNNAMMKFVGEADDATGASLALTSGIEGLAAWFEEAAGWIDRNTYTIQAWQKGITETFATIENWAQLIRDAIGVAALLDQYVGTVGDGPIWVDGAKRAQDVINRGGKGGRVTAGYNQSRISGAFGSSSDGTVAGKPVSLSDFSSGGKAGKSGSAKDNPWAGFGFSDETINSAEQMEDAVSAITDRNDELRRSFSSLTGGIVNGMMSGKTAIERVSNALDNVASQLMDAGINMLISGIAGGLGGGGVGGANPWAGLRSLTGRAVGGPVSKGKPYMVGENGPEMFIPSMAGKIDNGNGGGSGGNTIHVDARGAQAGVGEEIRRALMDYDRSSYSRTVANVQQARKRRAI
jgi:tape measure domain-containing protein